MTLPVSFRPIRHALSSAPSAASGNAGPPCFAIFMQYIECRMSEKAEDCAHIQEKWEECVERLLTK